jgi:hypothetical protein
MSGKCARRAFQLPLQPVRVADPRESEEAPAGEGLERRKHPICLSQTDVRVDAPVDRGVGVVPANLSLDRRRIPLIGPCDQYRVRARQAADRFPQQPAGEHVPVSERFGRVDQHEVEVAGELAVLKAVVHDEGSNVRLGRQHRLPAGVAIRFGVDDDLRLVGAVQQRFEHRLFVAALAGLGAVAAHQYRGAATGGAEAFAEPADDGRLAGAAGGEVADADDRAGEVADACATVEVPISKSDDGGKDRFDRCEESPKRYGPGAEDFPGDHPPRELLEPM